MASPSLQPDRAALLMAFDESRTGVRGLVESGVSSVHPDPYASAPLSSPGVSIPSVAATATAEATRDWGFFHQALAVPDDYPARALDTVRAFNEPRRPLRPRHGRRCLLLLQRRPVPLPGGELVGQHPYWPADPARIPVVCRDEILEWDAHATAMGRAMLGLLFEGLGLAPTALEEAFCLEGKVMVCHYYLVCPEPEHTMGIVAHTDPGVVTVLAHMVSVASW
ncbi:hypothetical protein EJB05_57968, partial [Eragrostis curvula]